MRRKFQVGDLVWWTESDRRCYGFITRAPKRLGQTYVRRVEHESDDEDDWTAIDVKDLRHAYVGTTHLVRMKRPRCGMPKGFVLEVELINEGLQYREMGSSNRFDTENAEILWTRPTRSSESSSQPDGEPRYLVVQFDPSGCLVPIAGVGRFHERGDAANTAVARTTETGNTHLVLQILYRCELRQQVVTTELDP